MGSGMVKGGWCWVMRRMGWKWSYKICWDLVVGFLVVRFLVVGLLVVGFFMVGFSIRW
jgi:hypothetical protein